MINSSRKVLRTYSQTCMFCLIQYIDIQNQSVEGSLKVLGKSLKIALDYILDIVSPYHPIAWATFPSPM